MRKEFSVVLVSFQLASFICQLSKRLGPLATINYIGFHKKLISNSTSNIPIKGEDLH